MDAAYQIISYLHGQMRMYNRSVTYAELERRAGIGEQRISQWKSGTRPSYHDVQKLGRALAQHYPELRIEPYALLRKAGYEPESDPAVIAFEKDVRAWDELTVKFHAASQYDRFKVIRAVEEVLGKGDSAG
ncbi:helix-turn-helix transcriptional regulator [Actinomadura sp. WMMB 499]|uniref:helix-turn-helix domain-containing protein n=1 Tax=Actinomadura sp. WMMB 499 TaxID=1219491 RepID=UPI001244FE79|nr:helix-turn-helix transcriptional regulator [Actinomadura sp. WMMB 499]QFG26274.1 helix-turn-helix transcriptional regulator [Actinomadura sp. WMMB 499]